IATPQVRSVRASARVRGCGDGAMQRYWQLARAGWRRNATYRAATFAGAFTNVVFGFLRAAVLVATLKVAGNIGGYDRADALTYTVSIVLAVVVSFGMRYIVNLGAFWLLDWRGLDTLSGLLVTVLSGFAIPLNFYPHWARTLTELLPWGSMVQLPINIFLEQE